MQGAKANNGVQGTKANNGAFWQIMADVKFTKTRDDDRQMMAMNVE